MDQIGFCGTTLGLVRLKSSALDVAVREAEAEAVEVT